MTYYGTFRAFLVIIYVIAFVYGTIMAAFWIDRWENYTLRFSDKPNNYKRYRARFVLTATIVCLIILADEFLTTNNLIP